MAVPKNKNIYRTYKKTLQKVKPTNNRLNPMSSILLRGMRRSVLLDKYVSKTITEDQ